MHKFKEKHEMSDGNIMYFRCTGNSLELPFYSTWKSSMDFPAVPCLQEGGRDVNKV